MFTIFIAVNFIAILYWIQ